MRCSCDLQLVIFKLISRIVFLIISCEIAHPWIPQDLADDKLTSAQVMVGAVKQQAFTWTNVDPDSSGDMTSLGHN